MKTKPISEEWAAARHRAAEEAAFWEEHAADFIRRYPDQFVALRNREIIATAPDVAEIVNMLSARGLEPKDVWLWYVRARPLTHV